jgi:putative ABC transport system permease protein
MSTLLRFGWRELRRARARATLIALILAILTAALGGGYVAQESLYFTRDTWAKELRLADLTVHFVPASAKEMPSLDAVRKIPGVTGVSRRFIALGYIETSGQDAASLPIVVQYIDPDSHPAVDDIALLAGRWLERGKPELAVVDRSFAEANLVKLGDQIVVNPHRFATRFTVAGTGLSAEHLVPTANPEMLVPHKGSLGIIYASREALDRTFSDELYNDIVVTFAPDADVRKTTDAVLASLGSLEIERVITKKSTFGYRFVDVMLSGSRSVTPTIALIIAVMAAIVAFISVHRLIAERRREIGCLLAQGFSPAELAMCFFGFALIPGIAGGLVGIPAAMAFAWKVTHTTAAISGFPTPIMSWSPGYLAMAFAAAVLVGFFSALPPALGVLRMRPSQALRGAGEVVFTGLPALFERLLAGSTSSIRYGFRNVFRRVRLSAATAALVALAVALPSGLLTSIVSWDSWARVEASKLHWDAIASFKVPLTDAHVAEVMSDNGIADYDGYVQGYAAMRRDDGVTDEIRVRGLPKESDLISYGVTSGRPFSSDDANEAILNASFSGDHPPRIGETVSILRKGVVRKLVLVGLMTDASLSTIIVPRGTAQRLFGLEGKLSGAYVRYGTPAASSPRSPHVTTTTKKSASTAEVLEKIDLEEASASPTPVSVAPATARDPKAALLDDELVTSVEVRTEDADATLKYLSAFNVIVVPFIGLSGILAFFFLLSVLGFLLLEREMEYATLRSMGYGAWEIALIIFTEVGVLAALGLMLSLGTWAATAYALRDPMAKAWFLIPLDFRAHDFFVASIPTLLFLGLAALPGIRALLRMDLSSSLRGRALG